VLNGHDKSPPPHQRMPMQKRSQSKQRVDSKDLSAGFLESDGRHKTDRHRVWIVGNRFHLQLVGEVKQTVPTGNCDLSACRARPGVDARPLSSRHEPPCSSA
jgi:hypothetical protein